MRTQRAVWQLTEAAAATADAVALDGTGSRGCVQRERYTEKREKRPGQHSRVEAYESPC